MLRIEPQAVEIIAEIVMRGDVAPAADARIGAQPMHQPVCETRRRGAFHRAHESVAIHRRDFDRRGEIRRAPFAADEGFRKGDVAGNQQAAERGHVVNDDRRLRTRLRAATLDARRHPAGRRSAAPCPSPPEPCAGPAPRVPDPYPERLFAERQARGARGNQI